MALKDWQIERRKRLTRKNVEDRDRRDKIEYGDLQLKIKKAKLRHAKRKKFTPEQREAERAGREAAVTKMIEDPAIAHLWGKGDQPATPQSSAARRSTLPESPQPWSDASTRGVPGGVGSVQPAQPTQPTQPGKLSESPWSADHLRRASRLPGQLAHYKNEVRMATTPEAKKFAEFKVKELTIALTEDNSPPIVVPATKEGRELFEARKRMGFTGDRYESAVPVDEHAEALKEAGKRTVAKPTAEQIKRRLGPGVPRYSGSKEMRQNELRELAENIIRHPRKDPWEIDEYKALQEQARLRTQLKEQQGRAKFARAARGKDGAEAALVKTLGEIITQGDPTDRKQAMATLQEVKDRIASYSQGANAAETPADADVRARHYDMDARAGRLVREPLTSATKYDPNIPDTFQFYEPPAPGQPSVPGQPPVPGQPSATGQPPATGRGVAELLESGGRAFSESIFGKQSAPGQRPAPGEGVVNGVRKNVVDRHPIERAIDAVGQGQQFAEGGRAVAEGAKAVWDALPTAQAWSTGFEQFFGKQATRKVEEAAGKAGELYGQAGDIAIKVQDEMLAFKKRLKEAAEHVVEGEGNVWLNINEAIKPLEIHPKDKSQAFSEGMKIMKDLVLGAMDAVGQGQQFREGAKAVAEGAQFVADDFPTTQALQRWHERNLGPDPAQTLKPRPTGTPSFRRAEGAAVGAPQEEDAREVVREKQQILEVAAMAGFGLEIDENNRERIVNPETGERVVGTTTGPDGEMLLVAETEDGKRIFINPNDPDKQVKWVL